MLEVVRPEHDDHEVERPVGQERREEQLAAVPVRLERVVPHGRASVQALLDDPVAVAELAPQARPASASSGGNRRAGSGPASGTQPQVFESP